MSFIKTYLQQAGTIIEQIDPNDIEKIVQVLHAVRERGGRLFLVGSGGGAGHASHAVCDFRKLCGFEAYCPTDNVSELTARINDEGWDTSISKYLEGSRLNSKDCVFVFSVGGGSAEKNISVNLVNAVRKAKEVGAAVVGVVGRDGGFTREVADACVVVPTIDAALVTPHTESFQALVWHCIVSHPDLQTATTKWESVEPSTISKTEAPSTLLGTTKLFADGAERNDIIEMYANPLISGFTTNPTLMKKAGITDYRAFALDILKIVRDRPISFEVFSDDFSEMEQQALQIASWGENVYVKIPITNTKGQSSRALVERLSSRGVKLNVTAIMTLDQVDEILPALKSSPGAYISVFAGRIADTGRDPLPVMRQVMNRLRSYSKVELIWASPRELLNIIQANQIGCHVITATSDILKKLSIVGKDQTQYSLETVEMFYNDAKSSGFSLPENSADSNTHYLEHSMDDGEDFAVS